MKKLLAVLSCIFMIFGLVACAGASSDRFEEHLIDGAGTGDENLNNDPTVPQEHLKISVSDQNYTIVFELNDSSASKSLYDQLPFTVDISNYANNEKIFYPPNRLDTGNVTGAQGAEGTLAYFSPWGNVVLYYGSFSPYNGLYALGNAVSGSESIQYLTGIVKVEKAVNL